MNAITKKSGVLSVLAALAVTVALFFGAASTANAALTIAATSITTDGAYTVTSVAASTVNMFAANTTGVITIGGTAQTAAIAIGDTASSILTEISIGGGNGVKTAINIGDGTGANGINIGTGATGVNTIGIGSGAAANVVTIGSVTGAASLDLLFGTGDFTIDGGADGTITIGDTAQTGTVTIGDSSGTLAIDIGTGEGATTIGIGTGATAANTINIGTGAVANTITIGSVTALGGIRYYENTEVVTATNIITAAETGTTFYISTTGATYTLPTAANGLVFRFVVSALFTTNAVIDSAEGDNIEGALIVAGAVVDCAAVDQINFVADGENLGDFVELRSDGTSWFIAASGALTSAKLTCTDPS